MISLRGHRATTYALIVLALSVAILIDLQTPPRRLVAGLYAVPILIAAHGLSRTGVMLAGAATIAVYLASAWVSDTPARLEILGVVGLVIVCYLSTSLAMQLDWAMEHAREAQELASLLNALLVDAPLGLVFWDRELRCAWINVTFAGILAVRPEQARGQLVRDLVGKKDDGLEDDVRWVLATGSPLVDRELTSVAGGEVVLDMPLLPGEEARWLASYYPVRSRGGDLVGIGCVAVQVTARR